MYMEHRYYSILLVFHTHYCVCVRACVSVSVCVFSALLFNSNESVPGLVTWVSARGEGGIGERKKMALIKNTSV